MTKALSENEAFEITQKVTEALRLIDEISSSNFTEISYETMQRSNFNRKNWQRKYTLADARSAARNAAIQLRAAWEILDPIN